MTSPLIESLTRQSDVASAEAQRLATTRDDLGSKYLFGLASFNAASIVAILTVMGGASDHLAANGIDQATLKWSLVFFTVGVIFAGIAIAATQNHLTVRAGYAAARVTSLDSAISYVASKPISDDGTFTRAHDESHELFLKGLEISHVAIWTQNMAAGAWLGGGLNLAFRLLGWT